MNYSRGKTYVSSRFHAKEMIYYDLTGELDRLVKTYKILLLLCALGGTLVVSTDDAAIWRRKL